MSSKTFVRALFAVAVIFGLGAGTASAQTTDTAVVTYEVEAITLLNLSGAASVKIVAGTAGQPLDSVTDSTGVTYDITNNLGDGSKKLVGKINSAMPANTVLSVNVTAPAGAVSEDFVALTTSDQDLVTGIDNVVALLVPISFKLDATVDAGVVASATKTFTMTVVAS